MFEIVTDSGSNLTAEQAKEWGVTVLPLTVEGNTTAQVNPFQAEQVLGRLAERKDVLCICMSSALSGTVRSMQMGAAGVQTNHRVAVVDSLCACCGEGMLVALAVRERRKGANLEKTLQAVRAACLQVCHLFLVGDVNHARRSGRFGEDATESVVLMLDLQGKIVPCHKSKDRKTALRYMAKMYRRTALNRENKIWIAHRNCFPDAAFLAGQIGADTSFAEINDLFTAHTGENTVALFYPGTLRTNPLD